MEQQKGGEHRQPDAIDQPRVAQRLRRHRVLERFGKERAVGGLHG